ncbi:hypothetical protein SAMD00019534_108420, partial [Acytostelium subglobosum LB1]|uniref:hypothetical protein n=1 Tax=Acytostelium subglobosum LB1 TaxID=1410327 RepID=UPI0006451BF8
HNHRDNQSNKDRYTMGDIPQLHDAILDNDYNKVKAMIESGNHKIDEGDFGGLQPLHFCARMGNVKMAELLLGAGADINADNHYGSTPMHEAVRRGEVEMVKFLIARKADLTLGDIDENTPLHLAIMCEDGELIPILMEAGAPLDLKNKDDDTPAQVTQDKEILEYIEDFVKKQQQAT